MAPFQHGTNCNAASSKFVGFEAAEICFDLYHTVFYLGIQCLQYEGIQLVHPLFKNTLYTLFTVLTPK